jgi:DUF4097 and DUF4098 domain-containing protein YvlB
MRTASTALLGAALVAAPLAAAPDMPVHRETSSNMVLRFEAAGTRTVDLRTISGTIRLTTGNREDVRLTLTRTTDAERESDLATADRDVRVETSTSGATVTASIRDREQSCGESNTWRRDSWWDRPRYRVRVDLTAAVPAGARVRLCTINGEAIVATGVLGDFDVSNVNGRIELSGVRGSGRATTVNGPVSVTFAESPRDASEFKTVNGDVVVTFPGDLSANLRLKTFHGELLTDFDVQTLPAQTRAVREERNGRTVYRSGGFTTVRAGGGGPELTFDTLNGDVRILRAAR